MGGVPSAQCSQLQLGCHLHRGLVVRCDRLQKERPAWGVRLERCAEDGSGLNWAQTPTLACSGLTLTAALSGAGAGLTLLSVTLVLCPRGSVTAPLGYPELPLPPPSCSKAPPAHAEFCTPWVWEPKQQLDVGTRLRR